MAAGPAEVPDFKLRGSASSVPKTGPDAPRALDPGMIERNRLDFAYNFFERDWHRFIRMRRKHHAISSFVDQSGARGSQPGGQNPVACRGSPPALKISKDRYAGLSLVNSSSFLARVRVLLP